MNAARSWPGPAPSIPWFPWRWPEVSPWRGLALSWQQSQATLAMAGRTTRNIKATLATIEAGKGGLYDPAVVEACLRLFRQKGYQLNDHTSVLLQETERRPR